MPLDAGTKLGPYEILSPLGAGGMGEVYRAHDSKLDRQVAIKVLPEAMTRDQERVARFEREAKLLASLNHPNIAAIYGFETTDSSRAEGFSPREETEAENATAIPSSRKLKHAAQGGYDSGTVQESHFLVMEYVEGETLAQRLRGGSFAVEDALGYGEPPMWLQPVRHTLGAVYLKSGRYVDAERVYREDLAKWQGNGWSLFGLSRALHGQGKIKQAKEVEDQYHAAWSRADAPTTTSCKCIPKI